MNVEELTVAQFCRFAERRLQEALLAAEADDQEQVRCVLGDLFYDIDRYLCPEPWQELEERAP